MRKLILIAILTVASINVAYTQDYQRDGNSFKKVKVDKPSSERETGCTWEDTKGNIYYIYMGPSGSCYIKRFSSKTGKEYKQYLGPEVSADICELMGVEYKPNPKTDTAHVTLIKQ